MFYDISLDTTGIPFVACVFQFDLFNVYIYHMKINIIYILTCLTYRPNAIKHQKFGHTN
jgi:hypothetical protein